MRLMVMLTATAVLSAMMLAGCASDQGMDPAAKLGSTEPVSISEKIMGSDPGFDEPGVFVAKSVDDLIAMGSLDLVGKDIDFNTSMVLVVALGEQPSGGYWVTIEAVQRKDQTLYVQGVANAPAPDQMTTQQMTYPYAAAVLPRMEVTQIMPEIESVVGMPMN